MPAVYASNPRFLTSRPLAVLAGVNAFWRFTVQKPKWVRARVEDDLRRHFKSVVTQGQYSPSEAIRMFMRRVVRIPHTTEPLAVSKAIKTAADDVANELRSDAPCASP